MYEFDKVIDRRGTYASKWDIPEGELPMWVADMDFETAPEILSAMRGRLEHGIFGYTDIPERWYEAYISWWERRYGFRIQKPWLVFCTGVIPAISSVVRKLTTPNEKVVIQTPVYHVFFNSILNNGCRAEENRLVYENGSYRIDLEDLEKKLADPQTTLMILCNPHNPTGMIWDRETLSTIGELCAKHNVTVISDEIHCDLTAPGRTYIPFASVSKTCARISITCIAPTKTFNIAGLKTAAVSVPDAALRHKVWRALNTDEVAEPNVFAVTAAIAAYEKGDGWLEELRAYVHANKQTVTETVAEKIPELTVLPSEATYLLWIDCTKVTDDSHDLAKKIRKETGLYLSEGKSFGGNGNGFLRMNVACPKELLHEGLKRLERYFA
ncbi:MAG: pyridoxal phosphate-dependent aminotransferase [Lachnospiraceae bacterium]|nr:pyridoxal phosphate-dependent aminotransferase [Lachnospiraceae bacterium]